MGRGPARVKPYERMMSRVNKTESCWLWKGGSDSGGYGHIQVDGKTLRTHVFSYLIHKGSIPKGLVVRHTCDTPRCVNPEHLILGTHGDNVRDSVERGRAYRATGLANGRAKLSQEDVAKIKELYATGDYTERELAKVFNVGHTTIHYQLRK